MEIIELERNDVEACIQWYREKRAERAVESWELRMLFKLQDDPTELRDRLAAENERRQQASA